MRNIPFTKSLIVSGSEREQIAIDFGNAASALEDSAALNMSLLTEYATAKKQADEYARLLVLQAETMQALMQINLLTADAIGKIREGADVEETVVTLEAALQEFDAGEALA